MSNEEIKDIFQNSFFVDDIKMLKNAHDGLFDFGASKIIRRTAKCKNDFGDGGRVDIILNIWTAKKLDGFVLLFDIVANDKTKNNIGVDGLKHDISPDSR